jgi:hypothetical protein
MHPVTPHADLLRSIWVSEFVSDLIRDMRDGPETLVFLLSQHPENYDAITSVVSKCGDSFITFSPHSIGASRFGLWILGFDADSTVSLSAFFDIVSAAPFDEGGIYIRGRHHLRLLPNEELQQPPSQTL